MEERKAIINLLKDYYGSSRDISFIEEISETIENNIFEIAYIYKDYFGEENGY